MRRSWAFILILCLFLTGCAYLRGTSTGRSEPDTAEESTAGETFPEGSVEVGVAPGSLAGSQPDDTDAEAASSAPSVIYQQDFYEVGIAPGEPVDETKSTEEDGPHRYIITDGDEDLSELNTAGGTGTVYTATDHVSWISCLIDGDSIVLKGVSDGESGTEDDGSYYLLELSPYEDSIEGHAMVAETPKSGDLSFEIALDRSSSGDRLYDKYVVCIWADDHYVAVSDFIYVTNPEAVARVTKAYQEPLSKKGLLIEVSEISDAFSLGVCNVIINIPFDTLFGDGIDYIYDGETYHFDKSVVEVYDNTISMFSNKSMNVHVILLNRYNPDTPDLFYPGVTGSEKGAMYYQFNASTAEGYKDLRAVASFLASRYSGTDPDHGLVQNWIIGNEINNQSWNYIGAMDLESYVREYARAFRVFYNAIKSEFASARVYFSLDNNWNQEADGSLTYTSRETLTALSLELSSHGNINWGLGYHPYPVPTNEPEFWDDFDTGLVSLSIDSPVVNFANLSVLTDFLQQDYLLDTDGNVRHIVLSEQGFTSESYSRGTVEELQAAAFAYAYYIVDSNSYIDSFILSRQIDAPSETKVSLAFGLWTTDAKEDVSIKPLKKKYIWNVFKHIDKQATTLEYSEFAKSIIGIDKWSDVITDFRWRKFEK